MAARQNPLQFVQRMNYNPKIEKKPQKMQKVVDEMK